MKIIMAIEAGVRLAKRFGIGIKDIKHLHNAIKKNKQDPAVTPEGEVDYVRLSGFISFILSVAFGIAYAFDKIDQEVYNKLIEVLQ